MTGHTFYKHIEDRSVRAMKATVEIKKLNLMSIATALKLFTIKVKSIQLIWNHLTYLNFKRL